MQRSTIESDTTYLLPKTENKSAADCFFFTEKGWQESKQVPVKNTQI